MTKSPKYPVISDDKNIQKFYVKCRKEGTSHSLAEMFALQQSPGISGTDSQFWAATGHLTNRFNDSPGGKAIGKYYKERAEKMAPGCTSGAVYMQGVSPEAGHPLGWVKNRSDVVRALKARGCDSEGIVNFKAAESQRDKVPVPLAPDIVKREVNARCARNPGADRRAVAEQVLHEKTPHWKQKLIEPYLKERRKRRGRRKQPV